jgi:hypothetical protein
VLQSIERRRKLLIASETLRKAWRAQKSDERGFQERRLAIAARLAQGADVI